MSNNLILYIEKNSNQVNVINLFSLLDIVACIK